MTAVKREGDEVPKILRIELPEGKSSDWWPCFDLSAMGQEAYEVRWFEDFRERWQRALRDEHWNFLSRLEAI